MPKMDNIHIGYYAEGDSELCEATILISRDEKTGPKVINKYTGEAAKELYSILIGK